MASSPEDRSSAASSALRRSVGEATDRIHEIIDATERVATEIRSEAEAEAEAYLAERRREADRLAAERTSSLDALTASLVDSAERFKRQAEEMLADLDRVIEKARSGGGERESSSTPEPSAAPLRSTDPGQAEQPVRPLKAAPEPQGDPLAPAVAYPGAGHTGPEREGDQTSEALLRATQMAVTGKERDEIVAALRADFPGVDAGAVTDEILG